ncbi:hypothetical protein EDD18DRAFT_1109357 [Armillaria luteobubalina]|uniref:Uncharacterized protein n=1 Tax=Armillaria luteobubalina TaxID=153913 RepID=A0AA39PZG5_9AGAR|nr:hypothetical protein EDD18DRAFT_1109357 [Armillaria luteobubalina]
MHRFYLDKHGYVQPRAVVSVNEPGTVTKPSVESGKALPNLAKFDIGPCRTNTGMTISKLRCNVSVPRLGDSVRRLEALEARLYSHFYMEFGLDENLVQEWRELTKTDLKARILGLGDRYLFGLASLSNVWNCIPAIFYQISSSQTLTFICIDGMSLLFDLMSCYCRIKTYLTPAFANSLKCSSNLGTITRVSTCVTSSFWVPCQGYSARNRTYIPDDAIELRILSPPAVGVGPFRNWEDLRVPPYIEGIGISIRRYSWTYQDNVHRNVMSRKFFSFRSKNLVFSTRDLGISQAISPLWLLLIACAILWYKDSTMLRVLLECRLGLAICDLDHSMISMYRRSPNPQRLKRKKLSRDISVGGVSMTCPARRLRNFKRTVTWLCGYYEVLVPLSNSSRHPNVAETMPEEYNGRPGIHHSIPAFPFLPPLRASFSLYVAPSPGSDCRLFFFFVDCHVDSRLVAGFECLLAFEVDSHGRSLKCLSGDYHGQQKRYDAGSVGTLHSDPPCALKQPQRGVCISDTFAYHMLRRDWAGISHFRSYVVRPTPAHSFSLLLNGSDIDSPHPMVMHTASPTFSSFPSFTRSSNPYKEGILHDVELECIEPMTETRSREEATFVRVGSVRVDGGVGFMKKGYF